MYDDISEYKIVHLRYDKYLELKEKAEQNQELTDAVKTLIKERDAAITDFNTLATETSYTQEDSYITTKLKIFRPKNGVWDCVWRGVKR